jgi:hypothetical protein
MSWRAGFLRNFFWISGFALVAAEFPRNASDRFGRVQPTHCAARYCERDEHDKDDAHADSGDNQAVDQRL